MLIDPGLLRQPGGFEGLVALGEVPLAHDHPTAQGHDLKHWDVEDDSADPAMPRDVANAEQPVTQVDDLLWIGA